MAKARFDGVEVNRNDRRARFSCSGEAFKRLNPIRVFGPMQGCAIPGHYNPLLGSEQPVTGLLSKIDCPTFKYCMDNHYHDERDSFIFRLMSPSDPARAADPATRSFRWALAEQRLTQMAAEAEGRVRVLERLGSPEF